MSATTSRPPNPRAVTFGRQLRAVMLEQNVSSRELGRRLAHDGLTSVAARRTVMKYLAGSVLPSEERRDELADALGVDRERLNVDEDDEESDLFRVLYQSLRAIARHEIQRELEREHL